MEKMLELDKRIHLVARLPPASELADAFNAFVGSKLKNRVPVEDFHAGHLLQTLTTMQEMTSEEQSLVNHHNLLATLHLLERSQTNLVDVHADLARLVYRVIQTRLPAITENKERFESGALQSYNVILARAGFAAEARDNLREAQAAGQRIGDGVWAKVIESFGEQNADDEVKSTLQTMMELDLKPSVASRRALALFFAQRNDSHKTKQWFDPEILRADSDTSHYSSLELQKPYEILLGFCIRNNELEWGKHALESAGSADAQQLTWNAVFQVAATAGKTVDDIDSMISVMARKSSADGEGGPPPIEIFNGLLQYAVAQKDPYTAERYYGLIQKWQAQPNARTYIHQIEYRLLAKDYSGAGMAYEHLRDQAIVGNEDWEIMNQFLVTLTEVSKTPHDIIMGLVEDLSERKKLFPAPTVKALSLYHLRRDEYFEIVDLLQTYAFQFNIAQRQEICDLLVDAALDPAADTGRSWDTYMIFHQVFDIEAKRAPRQRIMRGMFQRNRPDLATHVFTRMARHMRADTRPDAETYVLAFEGIAHCAEPEALEVIHNVLKLDTTVDPDTKLRNALMMAYAAVELPWRAIEFWDEIATSEEGPSYASLHIVFRACEKTPFGWQTAQQIWTRLRDSDIAITPALFADYVGSLSGNHRLQDAVEVIETMKEVSGKEVDVFT